MNRNKGLKYYAFVYLAALVGLVIYSVLQTVNGTIEFGVDIVIPIIIIPVAFTGFLWVFDRVFEMILPKRFKMQQSAQPTEYEQFLKEITLVINNEMKLSLEDSRKLRENEKFQKTLSQIFTIKKHGENGQLTFDYLRKKFKKDTNEYTVVNLIIDTVNKD